MAAQPRPPLLDFLLNSAWDHELHDKFLGSRSLDEFWNDRTVLEKVKLHGWDRLSEDQKTLFKQGDMLCHVQNALGAEDRGEDWSIEDVTGHQGPHFGPCWVLVRV